MRPRGDQVAILFLNTLGARSKWAGQRDQIEDRGLGEINRQIFISTHRCRCTQALERSEIQIRCTIVVSVSLCPVVAERNRRSPFQDTLSSTPCCGKGTPQVTLGGHTVQKNYVSRGALRHTVQRCDQTLALEKMASKTKHKFHADSTLLIHQPDG